jgi:hypothetical protein
VLNPFRSEAEAFRLFVWVFAIAAAIVLVVLAVRAIF